MTTDAAPVADLNLSHVMALLVEAQQSAGVAYGLTRLPGKSEEAARRINDAQEAVQTAMRRLVAAGVEVPTKTPSPVADPLSLSSLASLASLSRLREMDTPDARALLAGLSELLPVAERIDKERGHWFERAPATDTKGTDIAEAIHSLICRLPLELSRPRSRRGE